VLSAELAIVVIGGMVTSTFLTLFVIPAIYSLVHQRRKKFTA
jgi:hydrophobic/amphiphilic exporter-1 (mainly G- bacteria), HAE1 family